MLRETRPLNRLAKPIQHLAPSAFTALTIGQRGAPRRASLNESADVNYDLQAKYAHFNKLLFDGKLPSIPIRWATLKNEGGRVNAKIELDKSKPRPNPLYVRLGLEDSKSNWSLKPDTMHMTISDLYRRSEIALDKIMIHEMIHVLMYTTGHLGENHGELFQKEARRCGKIVGFDIPLKDNVEGFEFSQPSKLKPMGIVLVESNDRGRGYRYVMLPANFVDENIAAIRERIEYFVRYNYFKTVWVYVVQDQAWSDQSKKSRVQRQFNGKTAYFPLTDQKLIDDLHANGRLLAKIDKESLPPA